MDAYTFTSIHDKVAIQLTEYYITTNNLIILHWAVIYRVLIILSKPIRQRG
jgi:hypothetical protein